MGFDRNRRQHADRLMGGGAVALLIVLFVTRWYEVSSRVGPGAGLNVTSNSFNGWQAFTDSRWIWLITIIVALGAVALATTRRKLEVPVQPGGIVAGLGALSALLILYRIIHHPAAAASQVVGPTHISYSYGLQLGIWLGLIAALAVTCGGSLAMRAEGAAAARVQDRARREPDVKEPDSSAFSGLTVRAHAAGAASARGAVSGPGRGSRSSPGGEGTPTARSSPGTPPAAPSEPRGVGAGRDGRSLESPE
jgi:hypothetical protein